MKRFSLLIALLFTLTVCGQFGQTIGVIASAGSTVTTATDQVYVFDGDTDAYFEDESVTATLLDGVVSQTWVIRMEISGAATVRGILGTANGFGSSLNLEVQADNRIDGELRDTGQSSMINADVSADTGYNIYFFQYDGTNIEFYRGTTLLRSTADADFTGRTNGRALTVGGCPTLTTAIYFNGNISDIQFYSKALNGTERTDLTADITDTQTSLKANFAGNKTGTTWTSEIGGYAITNQGGVTLTSE